MKDKETLTGTQECPGCHHTKEIIIWAGEDFPSQFECDICGYSSPITWKKEPPHVVTSPDEGRTEEL